MFPEEGTVCAKATGMKGMKEVQCIWSLDGWEGVWCEMRLKRQAGVGSWCAVKSMSRCL